MCTRGPRRGDRRRCACGSPATRLCDGREGGRPCDRPLCGACAIRVGPNRDLCGVHAPGPVATDRCARCDHEAGAHGIHRGPCLERIEATRTGPGERDVEACRCAGFLRKRADNAKIERIAQRIEALPEAARQRAVDLLVAKVEGRKVDPDVAPRDPPGVLRRSKPR